MDARTIVYYNKFRLFSSMIINLSFLLCLLTAFHFRYLSSTYIDFITYLIDITFLHLLPEQLFDHCDLQLILSNVLLIQLKFTGYRILQNYIKRRCRIMAEAPGKAWYHRLDDCTS